VELFQAEAIVALVQAYFPRPELPPSTVMAWARELEPCDFGDAQEAARRLSRERSYPVLAEMLEYVEEIHNEREKRTPQYRALTAGEALAEMPPDVREKVHAMVESWHVERDFDAEEAEWKRVKATTLSGPRLRGVCNGAGKIPIKIGGQLVCPDCGIEVPDDIVRVPAKRGGATTDRDRP